MCNFPIKSGLTIGKEFLLPFGEQFTEEEFQRNLLESEKSRATILAWIFAFIWLAYTILILIIATGVF
jgi:hypothetical protein